MGAVADRADDNADGVPVDDGCDRGGGSVLLGSGAELAVGRSSRGAGYDDPGDDLVLGQAGGVVPDDELLDRDASGAARAGHLGHSAGGDQHRGRVGGVVGVSQDATHGGDVADPGTRHRAERGTDPGPGVRHGCFQLQAPVGDHGADREVPRGVDPLQLAHVLQ